MAVDPRNVRVTDFGAVGDNSHDDGPAIREAHEYCSTHRSGAYLPLHFPIGRYLIASGAGIEFVKGMHWTGEGHVATETDRMTQIRMNSDHLFKFKANEDADWVAFTGICFDGRNQSKSFIQPVGITDTSGRILFHSLFQHCGFKNFKSVFDGRLSGVRVLNNFFQNNKSGFRASGADNIIEDNYMSGSNYKPPSSSDPDGNSHPEGDATSFACELGSFRLCRFNKNYITGWPQQHLKITGSVEGSFFQGNWFDITDQCGVYAANSAGGVFIGNSFNRCMLGQDPAKPASSGTKDPDHDAFVRMKNCDDFGFYANSFGYIDNGLPAGAAVRTFHLTGCENIDTEPNRYLRPYKKLLVND